VKKQIRRYLPARSGEPIRNPSGTKVAPVTGKHICHVHDRAAVHPAPPSPTEEKTMTTANDTRHSSADSSAAADIAALVEAGTSALQEGDLGGALAKFETVVDHFPDRPEGHNNLGALYTSLGEFAKAEACFDKVLAIVPDNPNVMFNRGVVRTRLEKFDAARTDFKAVLAANPDDADTHNNLGVTSFMQGHFKHARRCFRKALKLRPDYTNALLNLVDVAMAEGDSNEAVTLCDTFAGRHDDAAVRRRLLDLLEMRCAESLARASRTAEALLVADGGDEDLRKRLGSLLKAQTALAE
jgi:Tfp pilus assembly protein PilF